MQQIIVLGGGAAGLAAALGAGAGYFCFFGLGPGMLWTAAGLLTAFVLRAAGERRPESS